VGGEGAWGAAQKTLGFESVLVSNPILIPFDFG
jgi:hypothetical protein